MNFSTFILSLLLSVFSLHQIMDGDVIKLISEIKMDTLYVYGEATMVDSLEAKKQAVSNLNDEIRLITDVVPDISAVNILYHMRGNRIRAFAYMERAFLFSSGNHTGAGNDDSASDIQSLENLIRSAKNIRELEQFNGKTGYPKWEGGIVDIDTPAEIIEKSYMLLLKGKSDTIQEAYSPIDKNHCRIHLMTGEQTRSIPFGKADKVMWIHM